MKCVWLSTDKADWWVCDLPTGRLYVQGRFVAAPGKFSASVFGIRIGEFTTSEEARDAAERTARDHIEQTFHYARVVLGL